MRKKTMFCLYGCFSVSRYIKEKKIESLDTIVFLDTSVYKQPKLTKL